MSGRANRCHKPAANFLALKSKEPPIFSFMMAKSLPAHSRIHYGGGKVVGGRPPQRLNWQYRTFPPGSLAMRMLALAVLMLGIDVSLRAADPPEPPKPPEVARPFPGPGAPPGGP